MDSCRNKRLTAKTYRYKSETHITEKRVREIYAVLLMVPTAQTPDGGGGGFTIRPCPEFNGMTSNQPPVLPETWL